MDLIEPDSDFDSAGELHTVLYVATSLIINGASAEKFLQWARSAIPHLFPTAFEGIDPARHEQAAYWIGAALWNAAPIPANHFRPAPLPKPQRNSPCPCGSTRKYKNCCASQPAPEHFPEDVYWQMITEVCSKQHINELQAAGQLPIEGITTMAYCFFQREDDTQVIKMLDPLFAGEATSVDRHHEALLDLLCDTYNRHYKTDKKKRDLLQRMCQHHNKVIRSAAWQRTASWQQDLGNFAAAHDAMKEAMRADPDNPSHALLELVLLVSSQQIDQARQRAAFWYARVKRHQREFPELVATVDLARTDPVLALQQQMRQASELDDDRLERLLAWLQIEQPLPCYRIKTMGTAQPPTTSDRDPLTRDLFDDGGTDDELEDEDPMAHAAILLPPEDVARLEAQWEEIRPLDKPFSIDFEPRSPEDIWSDPLDDEWLCFLEQHPQAINSLDVLDDVVTLMYTHPLGETPFGPLRDCYQVLQRAAHIVEQAALPATRTLPWIILENRPALRLLAHQIMVCEQIFADPTEAMRLAEHYLRINPTDNHGYRTELVNHCLREGRNQQAAAICAKYPQDMMAETRYGHVLALYRLGDLTGAAHRLSGAADHLPLVKDYLLRKRAAKPKLNPRSVRIGGKDQAWIYREEMRDSWAATGGCLEWLQKQSSR